jgi:hypothetical protein
MITKTSIRCTMVGTGETRFFRSVNLAASGLCVSEGAIRHAMREGRPCAGWMCERVPSVYVARMADDGNYYLCELSDGGGGFDVLGDDGGFLPRREIAELWNVTENFYKDKIWKK